MSDKRLIDANALTQRFAAMQECANMRDHVYLMGVLSMIDNTPTIDAVEVVHARWVQEDEDAWRCTCCGALWTFIDGDPEENDARFCPVCGAKMDAKEG